MNSRQLNFAYKVRHALNENLESLPSPAAERLAGARKLALARKKKEPRLRVLVLRNMLVTAGASGRLHPWLAGAAAVLPALALVAGLAGIYQFEQQRRIDDTAEMDAEMLVDELPLSAYLDHGFNAYLAKRGD
jgi:hypothetical protein